MFRYIITGLVIACIFTGLFITRAAGQAPGMLQNAYLHLEADSARQWLVTSHYLSYHPYPQTARQQELLPHAVSSRYGVTAYADAGNGQVGLWVKNLRFFPQYIRHADDGLAVEMNRYPNDHCQQALETQIVPVFRARIRQDFITQFHYLLLKDYEERIQEMYEAVAKKIARRAVIPLFSASVYRPQETIPKKYKIHFKEQTRHYVHSLKTYADTARHELESDKRKEQELVSKYKAARAAAQGAEKKKLAKKQKASRKKLKRVAVVSKRKTRLNRKDYSSFAAKFRKEKRRYAKADKRFVRFLDGRVKKPNPRKEILSYDQLELHVDVGNMLLADTGGIIDFNARVLAGREAYLSVYADTVHGIRMPGMIRLENADNCTEIDPYRFYRERFELIRALKIPDMKYYYSPAYKTTTSHTFTLYFDKNKSDYTRADIEPIVQYLQANKQSIVHADVTGFSSVEGPEERNIQLQQSRMQALLQLLQAVNEDSITTTTAAGENWEMFYQQIVGSAYSSWKQKSKEEVKRLLENEKNNRELEPLLSQQRRAVIKLTTATVISFEQKMHLAADAYTKAMIIWQSAASREQQKETALRQIIGIRYYVENALHYKPASAHAGQGQTNPCGVFSTSLPAQMHIADFYRVAAMYERGRKPLCQSMEEVVRQAHQTAMQLIVSAEKHPALQKKYITQCTDIQKFAYHHIIRGNLPLSLFCELNYPDTLEVYEPMQINRLSFALFANKPATQCLPEETLLEQANSLHYRLLYRKIFKYKTASAVDLYEFLYISVARWDEVHGDFYDLTVDEKVMAKLLSWLKSATKDVCSVRIQELEVSFHNKNAYYQAYRKNNIAKAYAALQVVYSHFMQHAHETSDEMALKLAKHFMSYCPKIMNVWSWSFDLLEPRINKADVDPQLYRYYLLNLAVYKSSFGQEIVNAHGRMSHREWCSLFTQAYDIALQWPTRTHLKQMYCEVCK
jgi:hypothetical protein